VQSLPVVQAAPTTSTQITKDETNHMDEVPHFDEAQKKYFQEQLAAQSGKHLVLAPELLTAEQKAQQAHEAGDIDALKDLKVRAAYLSRYGVNEFGKLHLRSTREKRERERQAEQELKLADNKRRLGIRS